MNELAVYNGQCESIGLYNYVCAILANNKLFIFRWREIGFAACNLLSLQTFLPDIQHCLAASHNVYDEVYNKS